MMTKYALTTEEEAKKKWCPFSRLTTGVDHRPAGNRPFDEHPAMACLGSSCMAWRWGAENAEWVRNGFCGMAGNP